MEIDVDCRPNTDRLSGMLLFLFGVRVSLLLGLRAATSLVSFSL